MPKEDVVRTGLVLVHALPGVIGLVAGLMSLAPPRPVDRRRGWRLAYTLCIATLIAGLVVLIGYDWGDLDATARIAFTGLVGLGAVMGFRLWRSHREASLHREGWHERYINHVYFT